MSSAAVQRPLEILLVEDSYTDVTLIRAALEGGRVSKNVTVADDGLEAMAILRQAGPYSGAPRPDLVILDLHLCRKDGCEVLEEMKSDPRLKNIPVVVFTSSQSPEDARRCYELQANSVVSKPLDLDDLMQTVWSIEKFWFNTARIPV